MGRPSRVSPGMLHLITALCSRHPEEAADCPTTSYRGVIMLRTASTAADWPQSPRWFAEYFPRYMAAHSKPGTRWLGSTLPGRSAERHLSALQSCAGARRMQRPAHWCYSPWRGSVILALNVTSLQVSRIRSARYQVT